MNPREQPSPPTYRLSEFLRDHIPGATLVEVPGAGHVSNLENPEFFSAAARAILAEHEA